MNLSTNTNYTLPAELQSRFQVLSEIARTRTSVVYLAKESLLDRKIALKISACPTEEQAERFRREAQTLASLKHPNIVQLYSFGAQLQEEAEGQSTQLIFLAMEFLEGKTLQQRLSESALDCTQFQEIFFPVLDALDFAHSAKIIHRDLKPANIMLIDYANSSPIIKVLDFGISKQTTDSGQTTITRELIGTPKYMSPEQCKGQTCTVASDIYSLACVMYEAISGEPPFSAETAASLMYKHIHEEAPALKNLPPERKISRELVSAVMMGLQKDPLKRPQSMEQFKSLIAAGLDSRNFSWSSKKFPVWLAILILVCIVLPMAFLLPSANKPHKRVRKEAGLADQTDIERDRRKGADIIREECRGLRARGKYKESAERLEAVLNDKKRNMDKGVRYCLLDETAKSYDGLHDYPKAEQYWRMALQQMPWDMQDQYPITMDRLCQVLVASGRTKEAEEWCDKEIKKADSSNQTLIADFRSIKARAIMGIASRKKEALELLKQSLSIYDKDEQTRSSKIAMGAGKDIYTLAKELGKPDLANKELDKTKNAILHFEAPEGSAVWNALNLSYFMADNNRIEDSILLRERSIQLAQSHGYGTREIPKWQAEIDAMQKKLHASNSK